MFPQILNNISSSHRHLTQLFLRAGWVWDGGYLRVTVLNKAVYKVDSRPCFPFSISMKHTQWQLPLYLPASLSLSLSLSFTFLEHSVLSVLVFLHSPSAKSSSCTCRVSVHEHVNMHRFSTYTCSGAQLSKYTQCCFVCLPSWTQVGHYLLANVLTRHSVCLLSSPSALWRPWTQQLILMNCSV